MKTQKFNKGDLVKIADDLGPYMSHFQKGCEAIVIGSYAEKYWGDNVSDYTIYIENSGESSWYKEEQLTLIERNRRDLLEEWQRKAKEESDLKSDINWIFKNGKSVLDNPHGASISTLAKCFGLEDLWGGNGEGINYYHNSMITLQLASPYLISGDKEGWLKYCEELKSRHSNA